MGEPCVDGEEIAINKEFGKEIRNMLIDDSFTDGCSVEISDTTTSAMYVQANSLNLK